jgi:hypothetical protein
MAEFIPAEADGHAVATTDFVPIVFNLENE